MLVKHRLDVRPVEAADPLVGRWLAYLAQSRERTLGVLEDLSAEGVAADAVDAASDEHSNSVGTLLYHIAAIEMDWLYCEILERDIPQEVLEHFPYDVRDASGRLTPVRGWTLEQYAGLLERTHLIFVNTLRDFDADEFLRARVLPDYDVTPEWVCLHLLQHEAGHRGQMVSWLERLSAS